MKKRLLSLVVAGFVVAPFLSFGAGLGSVRTYSNLNERLRAEIPVLSVKQRGKMSVALAPDAVFSQRGIARSQDVRNLRFSLVKKGQRYYVKVSSVKPVSTPYLNFILELKDEEGKSHREYAVFLDPPSPNAKKSKRNLPEPRKKEVRKDKQQAIAKKETKQVEKKSKRRAISLPSITSKVGTYGPVKRGETLSGIALRVKPSKDISIQQMIGLLREANPKLKYGLKADSILKIPTIKGYSAYQGGTGKATSVSVQKVKTDSKSSKAVAVENVKVDSKPNRPVVVEKNIKIEPIVKAKTISRVVSSINESVGSETTAKPVKTTVQPIVEKVTSKPISKPVEGIKVIALGDEKGKSNVEIKAESTETTTKIISSIQPEQPKTASLEPKPVEKVEKPIAKPIAKPIESVKKPITKPTKPVKKPVPTNIVAETEESDFSWLLWLGGGIIALLGVLGLGAFAWKKRKSSSEERVVLLDDDDVFDEPLDETLSVTEVVDDEETLEQIDTGGTSKETEDAILQALEKDIALEKEVDKDFEKLLSATDSDDLSFDDEPFDSELFDANNVEEDVSVNKPLNESSSALSSETISTVTDNVEELENSAEDNGLVFDLDKHSEEIVEEEKVLSEEVSESSNDHSGSLDFNLDEFSQTEVKEDVSTHQIVEEIAEDEEIILDTDDGLTFEINDDISDDLVENNYTQSDKEPTNEEESILDTDDGLTFEVNDGSADDLIEEETTVKEEAVSDPHSLDFDVNDEVTIAENENINIAVDETHTSGSENTGINFEVEDNTDTSKVEEVVEANQTVGMVNNNVSDNQSVLDDSVEKTVVKEKTEIKGPKPFAVDKVAGTNVDLSSFASLNLVGEKSKATEKNKETVTEEQVAEVVTTPVAEEPIVAVEKMPVIEEKAVEVKENDVLKTVDTSDSSDKDKTDKPVELVEKVSSRLSNASAKSTDKEARSVTSSRMTDKSAANNYPESHLIEAVVVSEKAPASDNKNREPLGTDSYLERYKAREIELSKRAVDSKDDVVSNRKSVNNDTVAKSYRHTEIEMKMAMAETFISVSNYDRAKELLQYIIQEGSDAQIDKAKSILREIG